CSFYFFFSSRRRHTRWPRDWSSDVCSSDLVFFIIVCTAATLYVSGHRDITDAAQAAQALIPLAGKGAGVLFAFGLLNASLFAARSEERRVGKECRFRWSREH